MAHSHLGLSFKVLRLPHRGKGAAVRAGVDAATGDPIAFLDADLTIPVEIIDLFIGALDTGADIAIASRYADLVPDAAVREAIFPRLANERERAVQWLLAISGQTALLDDNPTLARSIRNRFPYLDPLNHVQVELLKEHRAQNPDEQVLRGIQLTINGISAGLRNSG